VSVSEERDQEQIHTALGELLPLEDGEMLAGWIVIYETVGADDRPQAGHVYGPAAMTTWRAMGLVEWARARTLPESTDLEDDDE
jgi:hypothetical protein